MMEDIIEQIRTLKRQMAPLEPDATTRASVRDQIIDYTEEHLEKSKDAPAYVSCANQGKGNGIYDSPINEEPADLSVLIDILKDHVDPPGISYTSGGQMGYIPSSGMYYSALGDYIADVTNKFPGFFFASPGAVRIENLLLKWIMEIVGYPETAAGNLTSGGSIANLTSIVTAREAHQLKARDYHRTVIYLSEHTHHSIDKALRIAGLKDCIKRYIPLDENYRMRADVIEDYVHQDRNKGLNPWMIVASAGTTNVGAIDPLDAIGDIANANGLWYHIDGAYGAFFALCEEGKQRLKGMEKSDSIIMDPHKSMFLPYGSGVVLIKDGKHLFDAHYAQASYIEDSLSGEEHSPANYSPELSRNFRGMRLWLPLKLIGVSPFRAALEEKMLLAQYFYKKIQELEGFEVGPYPDLSIVTFRYIPKRGDANEFNQKLLQEIKKDGRVFLSSTILDGKFTIRLAVLASCTHLDQIEMALDILKEKVRALEDEQKDFIRWEVQDHETTDRFSLPMTLEETA